MKIKQAAYDGISYIAPTWEEMGHLCFEVAKQVLKSHNKYDRVIALAKGGWTWTRSLVDYLQIEKVASIQVKFYSDIGQTNETPVILQSLPIGVEKEKILLFDDVVDTGKTIEVARDYILKCGAKSVDIGALFYKPHSSIKPKFFSSQTSAWVIFPHELREIVIQAGAKWIKNGVSKKTVLERFSKLGLPSDQVKYFVEML
ncbi:hypothetical protein HY345_02715 [Candidatus Microgenomates bacterium]|nr:hypothetical protein [Candidatus Microgenomates bacterium]